MVVQVMLGSVNNRSRFRFGSDFSSRFGLGSVSDLVVVQGYCRMHANKSCLGNDITRSYIASLAQEYSGYFFKAMARLE
ncbi:hypothetical protein Hdeb2414_s0006g00217751 [Helianthus debilis subsp. tardiflorus]